VNSLDIFETYLWFRSRGDECVNCLAPAQMIRAAGMPLVVRVKTREETLTAVTR
jgi:hypothetical protein